MCDNNISIIESHKFCRICHDDQGDLYKVCNCKGSIGLVHLECEEKWLSVNGVKKSCDLCGYKFKIRLENRPYTEVKKITKTFYSSALLWESRVLDLSS